MLPQLFLRMQQHYKTVLHEPLHLRNLAECDLCGELHN